MFQFPQVILALGDYMSIQCHACIGGTNVGEDIRKLDYGQHVVSGTPGRVFGKFFIFKQLSLSSNRKQICCHVETLPCLINGLTYDDDDCSICRHDQKT